MRLRVTLLLAAFAGCGNCGHGVDAGGGGGGGGSGGRGGAGAFGGSGTGGGTADVCTGQCGSAGCGDCPDAGVIAGQSFDIDRTEVTNGAYAAWLATFPKPPDLPPLCAGHPLFTPPSQWPPTAATRALPVVFVHWCAAWAYCHWARRHLCGAFDGGELAYDQYRDPSQSEWMAACGPAAFPYGDTYDPDACNSQHDSSPAAEAVGSFPRCDGGLGGLVDMSGNVAEWEDSCEDGSGALDTCHVRGGAFDDQAGYVRCDDPGANPRNTQTAWLGFRCCSP